MSAERPEGFAVMVVRSSESRKEFPTAGYFGGTAVYPFGLKQASLEPWENSSQQRAGVGVVRKEANNCQSQNWGTFYGDEILTRLKVQAVTTAMGSSLE